MDLKGFFIVLFALAILGAISLFGGAMWGFWWVLTHVSISFV
jgi:hypothetical protein